MAAPMIRLPRPLAVMVMVMVASAAAAQNSEVKPKVLLLPLATLSGDVPPRVGPKALGMLATELKNSEKVELVEPAKSISDAAASDAVEAARKLVEDAKALRAKKKFRLADEALQKAIAAYRSAPSLLTDVSDVADAMSLLSAVQFNTGRDEEGAKSLTAALSLAPDRELPLARTSALFSKVVADARKAIRTGPKGTMSFESVPSNAAIFVDGVLLGSTPLNVRDVPPGQHFWRAQLPSGEVTGAVTDVTAGKNAAVKVTSQNNDAGARLLSALAQNKVDAEAISAAKEVAKSSRADVVFFGALSRTAGNVTLDSFALTASSGEVKRLPSASFDTGLLSAGMELFNVSAALTRGASAEPFKVPGAVTSSPVVAASKQADVKYGQSPGHEVSIDAIDSDAPALGEKDEPRKPLERRVPLKKK